MSFSSSFLLIFEVLCLYLKFLLPFLPNSYLLELPLPTLYRYLSLWAERFWDLKVHKIEYKIQDIEHKIADVEHEIADVEHKITDVELEIANIEHKIADVELEFANIEHKIAEVECKIAGGTPPDVKAKSLILSRSLMKFGTKVALL